MQNPHNLDKGVGLSASGQGWPLCSGLRAAGPVPGAGQQHWALPGATSSHVVQTQTESAGR